MIDEATFAAEARAFLASILPRKGGEPMDNAEPGLRRARGYQARLAEGGYAGISWPVEYGGRGLPERYERIFRREASAFQTPPLSLEIGLGMCGPTVLVHGTEEQKQRFIPPLLRGEHVWCELFSEPGSGSDLASVQARATLDGDSWIVEGQKVWTSGAQNADYAACLTRTDPDRPKRDGITMLIVDMHAPGITVRPLRQMTGDAHFNEVFLDEVRVPAANVLGEVNAGWRVARTMLAFERGALGAMGSGGGGKGGFAALAEVARQRGLLNDPVVRQQLASLRIRQTLLRNLGAYFQANRARATGAEGSLLKLAMAGVLQDTADVATRLAGPDALLTGRWSAQLLNAQSSSIGGGTNEIVRNVIAEVGLGLPREIEVDANVAFRDLKVGTQRG
jgi:alkylation response protein AidB-like acyl-CoA dehydrogenase